jgi:hypothetical protein
MMRSLNIESSPLPCGGGSSFGETVRKEFEDMKVMQGQGVQIQGMNKFEIRKHPNQTAVRPPWTPPNSPKMQKESTAVEETDLANEVPGSNGRR